MCRLNLLLLLVLGQSTGQAEVLSGNRLLVENYRLDTSPTAFKVT